MIKNIKQKVDKYEGGLAESIINNVIWGNHPDNPNNIDCVPLIDIGLSPSDEVFRKQPKINHEKPY